MFLNLTQCFWSILSPLFTIVGISTTTLIDKKMPLSVKAAGKLFQGEATLDLSKYSESVPHIPAANLMLTVYARATQKKVGGRVETERTEGTGILERAEGS